jgi:hypothetical protein
VRTSNPALLIFGEFCNEEMESENPLLFGACNCTDAAEITIHRLVETIVRLYIHVVKWTNNYQNEIGILFFARIYYPQASCSNYSYYAGHSGRAV